LLAGTTDTVEAVATTIPDSATGAIPTATVEIALVAVDADVFARGRAQSALAIRAHVALAISVLRARRHLVRTRLIDGACATFDRFIASSVVGGRRVVRTAGRIVDNVIAGAAGRIRHRISACIHPPVAGLRRGVVQASVVWQVVIHDSVVQSPVTVGRVVDGSVISAHRIVGRGRVVPGRTTTRGRIISAVVDGIVAELATAEVPTLAEAIVHGIVSHVVDASTTGDTRTERRRILIVVVGRRARATRTSRIAHTDRVGKDVVYGARGEHQAQQRAGNLHCFGVEDRGAEVGAQQK
jgi:hypothetical protein